MGNGAFGLRIAIMGDFHFGYERFYGDSFTQAGQALLKAQDEADLILIAGDIFDSRVPKPETVAKAFDIFRKLKKKTIVIHGTHERRPQGFVNPVELLCRAGLAESSHAKHVFFEKDGERVAVYGLAGVPEEYAKAVLGGKCQYKFCHLYFSMYVYEGAEDSYLLSEVLKQRKCRRFLDMGCGNGIQAMSVLDAGEIVCADINPEAVEIARMSIKSENVDFVVSDLFRNISGKFDLIAFNTPYLDDSAPRDVSWTHMQGGKDVIRRFIKESKQFLEEDGCIVMLISNRGYGEYKKLAEETGFTWSVLREKGLFFERLFVVELRMRPERDV